MVNKEPISMSRMQKICKFLGSDIGDVKEIIEEGANVNEIW